MKATSECLITVAIPTRNRAFYLYHALESCRLQPAHNFQYLVVDNNSEDNTSSVCAGFEQDPRFKYVRYEELGNINDQFARCLKHANGEWLSIIGDDDCIFPDFGALVEIAIEQAHSNSVDCITWDACIYRWPSFSGRERNFYKWFGLNSRYEFSADHMLIRPALSFQKHLNSNLKLLYQAPGVYHKACRITVLHALVERYGEKSVFFHSADISVSAHFVASGEAALHLRQPLSITGYSGESTGASHSVGKNDEVSDRYFKENPDAKPDYLALLQISESVEAEKVTVTEVGVTFLIVSRVLQRYGMAPPTLIEYVRNEINNAEKLSPDGRPIVKGLMDTLIKINSLDISEEEMLPLASAAPPKSLPDPDPSIRYQPTGIISNGEELVRLERTMDCSQHSVHSILDAALYCYFQLRFK